MEIIIEYFLEQPFHVPSLGRYETELAYLADGLLKPLLLALPTPKLVSIVRSPGYAPGSHLHDTECRVLQLLSTVYKTIAVQHEERVDPRKTNCARIPKYQYALVPDE